MYFKSPHHIRISISKISMPSCQIQKQKMKFSETVSVYLEKSMSRWYISHLMVLTAYLHSTKWRVRWRLVPLSEGGGPRSAAHPAYCSTTGRHLRHTTACSSFSSLFPCWASTSSLQLSPPWLSLRCCLCRWWLFSCSHTNLPQNSNHPANSLAHSG